MRRKRRKRRRKLLLWNVLLLAGIIGMAVWNLWQNGKPEAFPGFLAAGGETDLPGSGAAAQEETSGAGPSEPMGGGQDDSRSDGAEPVNGADEEGEEDIAQPGPQEEGRVKLAIVGDVLLGESVGRLLKQNGYDYPYEHVSERLRAADLAIANLETAVTSMDGEKPGLKTYEFRSDPAAIPAFAEAGFDLVNLANNHTLDFGPQGLRDTMKHLRENGIRYVGAGESRDEAFAPAWFELNGLKIAVFGFSRVIPDGSWKAGESSLGLADTYDYTKPVEVISEAAETADVVVVIAHWGEEGAEEPHPQKQVELGRRFIDAGADLVAGSHPHVLQGFEYYGGGWIAYSLGNFIFTKSKNPLTYDTGILEADCGKEGCELQLFLYRADTPQPRPMSEEREKQLLRKLSSLSYGAEVREDGTIRPEQESSE